MRQGGRFREAQEAIIQQIDDAPRCTLAIVASFGVTADVVQGEFVLDEETRQRLADAVRTLQPTHAYTNFDEAAKLIELLAYQIQGQYGATGMPLWVNAYTDGQSQPSQGKPKFSLADYLTRRMGARHLLLTPAQLGSFQGLGIETKQNGTDLPAPPRAGTNKVWSLPVFVGLGIGLLFAALVVIKHRMSRIPVAARIPLDALLVTEQLENDKAAPPLVIASDRRIPIAERVPVVFATDAASATYVAAVVPGAASGELFRIEPLLDGCVSVHSSHPRLTVNDEPLDVDRRRKVDLREPIRIRLGPREFKIVGVFGQPRAYDPRDEIFEAEPLQH
jgi:hypothetical protein